MKKLHVLFLSFIAIALVSLAQSAGPGSARSIRFGWTASTEAGLAGYVFYYGILGGATNSLQVATNTITINGLANGRYWFGCTARDTNNLESDFSNIVMATVPRNPQNLLIQ